MNFSYGYTHTFHFEFPIKVRGSKTTSSDGPRIWAKKIQIFFSKGQILARKTAHFSTFRTVNDHFLIARRSSLEILVFSPRSKFGGAKRPARTGREDGQKKLKFFFSKGRILAFKKAHFFFFLENFQNMQF